MFRTVLFVLTMVGLAIGFFLSDNLEMIAAGIAVLLLGMKFLENGFDSIASGPLYKILKKVSGNFVLSFLLGFFATAILQSSSLITVIAITFLSTGILSLRSGLGIVFGANLGTTSTAWIVAYAGLKLDISSLALPMIVFGSILFTRKVQFQKAIGNVLLGLGGFFMGIYAMQLGFANIEAEAFLSSIAGDTLPYLAIAVLVGIALTGILQSSSATMAIIISALAGGQISYTQSLALAVGANIGSTFTALLGSISARIEGKRLAWGHLIFNLGTGILALLILPIFVKIIDTSADLLEIDHSQLTLELALFHTLFNLLGIVVLLPFVGKLERFLTKKIKPNSKQEFEPKYLQPGILQFPQTAFTAVHNETKHVFGDVLSLLQNRIDYFKQMRKSTFLQELNREEPQNLRDIYYAEIKPLLAQIQDYAARLSNTQNTNRYSVVSRLLAEIIRDFDHMFKDTGKKELLANLVFMEEFNHMLSEIENTILSCQVAIKKDELNEVFFEAEVERVEQLNENILLRTNKAIANQNVPPLIGTTVMHNADYTKRIVKKIIRATRLIIEDRYLEIEAEQSLEEKHIAAVE